LKENLRSHSIERLPEVDGILRQTEVTSSPLYSPAKVDTLKMRKLRERVGRSAARRIQLHIMESPERQERAFSQLSQQKMATPIN
jgi:hypothetical protein